MNSHSKRVAVVGAGPSGVVAVKELLEEGHKPTCFERASSLGGVFRFGEHDGVVWDSCRLTSSGLLTQFSDYPIKPDLLGHITARQYATYLAEYCDAFDVTRHLRFQTTVESITPSPDGGWSVQFRDADGLHEQQFDAVAICSGLHQHPHLPSFPGQETFAGEILHGASYRRPAQVAGRKVLVVGAGESGADIVAEVSAHAAETVLSLKRGVAALSRIRYGWPNDYRTTRIVNSASHWVTQTRNPKDDHKRKIYRYVFLPLVVVDKCLQIFFKVFWELMPLFYSGRVSKIRADLETRRLTSKLLKESGGEGFEQFGTKTDEFVRAMVLGRCRRVVGIDRFEGRRVSFTNGESFEPDVVIFCTGFDVKTPFLNGAGNATERYLHTFDPAAGASLGFIGFLRPAYGAIPPLAELQARWFALLQSGRLRLPSREHMLKSIEKWSRFRLDVFRAVRGRLDYLVDHTPFCDELAAQVGCKPTREALRRESFGLRLRFFAGPFVAAQYRLIGPHSKPSLAREAIRNLPVTHPLPELFNMYLRWSMSRILHWALGPEFAPKLELE